MTDYMFDVATGLLGDDGGVGAEEKTIKYVDLGSGTGAAALRLCQKHDVIAKATCLNLCEEQNALARKCASDLGLEDRIAVVTGTYESAPFEANSFDIAFSQDAFVHAFSKVGTFREALRVTKPGGVLVFCDLMCGSGDGVSEEELATFAATNMVNDWLSPDLNVRACQEAGWTDVKFVDLTLDIRISFQLMLKKVEKIIQDGNPAKIDEKLLDSYKKNLANRIVQVDRGVFKWGVVTGKKPLYKFCTRKDSW
ncbi:methyl transferase-like protein [Thalassiosira pseudonana CCMP1335]|uniref:Methyl transferase-like protein n=1 Tax=Thalassiosira pseudonana TaxID=35128 RepID=B8C5X1_THAPS|nr:methyl transferase-like protein [Thalassiosira pseudonana CCMP1335]EED91580.1 methyl transferase-like protein [Thalassiosira pseudonana CCMP1335]